ncbi:MAG: YerC/YecD family TrpR-related protein [bacterium]
MDINWEKNENRELVKAILSLQNTDEAERFLRDIMTKQEIDEFSKRFLAAQMLSKNTQYTAIIEKTGLSSTTIARISKWLKGPLGGYRLVINNLHHNHSQHSAPKGLFLNS